MNSQLINKVTDSYMRTDLPNFKAGDLLRVHVRMTEGKSKERIQIFEGYCIAKHNNGVSSSFIVRKISFGIAVERVFSFNSPTITKIEVVKIGKVRRAKLYYLRERFGKNARVKHQ